MQKREGIAEVNGTRLHYEVLGSGHPLILIHGHTLDARMWDDQFEPFAEHYQVVRYDVRGYGQSAVPTQESYSHVEDLKSLMEFLDLDRAHIVGLSKGGGIAIDFAVEHSERVSALIPVDSGLGGFPWPAEISSSMESVVSEARDSGLQAAKKLWLAHPMLKPATQKPDAFSRLRQQIHDYSGWHWLNSDPARAPDPPAIQRLDAIGCPTLSITGELDLPHFHAIGETLEQRIPARRTVIPQVGHMSNMEDPSKFNEAVLDFLQETEAS